MEPELDYAFLADYATVAGDRLTAVGASFTRLTAVSVPTQIPFSLAARVRASADDEDFPLEVRVTSPDEQLDISTEFTVSPSDAKHPYGDDRRVGVLITLSLNLPMPSFGLYTVRLLIKGREVRDLKFQLLPEG